MLPPSTATRVRLQRRPDFGSPVMYQSWRDLLFLHWKVPSQLIQETLPDGLFADTYRGDAYISVVPFKMLDIHPRGLPTVPVLSYSLELNLRTYVYNEAGIPGVWFYSLDADNRFLVFLANKLFKIPYYRAAIQYLKDGNDCFQLSSRRIHTPESSITKLSFKTEETCPAASSESLEFFLLERYLFFGYDKKKDTFIQGRIHHKPYPFQDVSLTQYKLGLLGENNFNLNRDPDAAQFSSGVDVEIFGKIAGAATKEHHAQLFGLEGSPETAFIGEFPH